MVNIKDFFDKLPGKINADAVEGMSSVFHFDIGADGQYTLSLNDGKLSVEEGLVGEPSCKVTSSKSTLEGLLNKDVNPMMAMMTGKLKISNPGEMMKYAKIFGLM
ncbi:MAG: SCP2 sterol-binding domain-containing protein [Saprospiraceae bacterium]